MGKCIVRLRAPLKDPQVIEMRIRRMQVGVLKNSRCEGAHVQFSDEQEDLDENAGRYCGHVTGNTTRLFLRRGPDLSVILDSETRFAAENPVIFSAQYSILPARLANERHHIQRNIASLPLATTLSGDCPLECTQRNDRKMCRLVSPGYPGIYPRNIRCRVELESSAGRFRIGGGHEDVYNLMNHTSQEACSTEFCEQEHVELGSMAMPSADQPEEERINLNRPKTGTGKITSFTLENRRESESESHERSSSHRQRRTGGQQHRHLRKGRRPHDSLVEQAHLGSGSCVGDYLALMENFNGRLLEIGKFCGEGHFPQILTRGRNLVVEFRAERDGTVMHDGFHLSIQESEAPAAALAAAADLSLALPAQADRHKPPSCDFTYRSNDKAKDSVKSLRSWYPPETLCNYRFVGKVNERVSVLLKIVREETENGDEKSAKKNVTSASDHCTGNEIAVYNGTEPQGAFLLWSFCDATHTDINNIQVPIMSTNNLLLIQFYSATGSYDGQDFTYSITYKFVRKAASATSGNATKRQRQGGSSPPSSSLPLLEENESRLISLKPVNLSTLNLDEAEGCNCNFADRIGSFKSWFVVLVVLGVISFAGALATVIALICKCVRNRRAEKKLIQRTPKRSSFYYKGPTD
uniref:CUB domain-containing protein n=2 Tax=Trichogramma kaykai TaxID=54128 RepID=A0ABD2XFV1_9HYME